MKILILVDLLNDWALHNRAKAIRKLLPHHQIDIRAALGNPECLIDEKRFDIIHFNFTWGLTKFSDFIFRNVDRCVFTIVNERSLLQGAGVDLPLLKEIFEKAKYITAVNRKMSEMTDGIYIPNGIDEDLFSKIKCPVVGYSGTDMVNKNMHIVQAACLQLGVDFKPAIYRRNNGIRLPDLPHECMHDYYRGIDVFVHASITEGFSNTVLEALACNIPVLMTREGAWKEFEGWVDFIEPTIESVKEGLQKFTGRRLVDEKFLWKNIVPEYEKIYRAVYENNHRV